MQLSEDKDEEEEKIKRNASVIVQGIEESKAVESMDRVGDDKGKIASVIVHGIEESKAVESMD